ncbi:hypothetical protein BUH_4160 [Burkholderia pseudomallei Pakistan 9]|nr:hypothetical protein BURPSPAST_Y0285 [Burkholderia pseudomallei Pasteur 52237]EEH30867.1 hypothetical protein BUH_4160 [Burkholderia pseudomallei Pakistan 9]
MRRPGSGRLSNASAWARKPRRRTRMRFRPGGRGRLHRSPHGPLCGLAHITPAPSRQNRCSGNRFSRSGVNRIQFAPNI